MPGSFWRDIRRTILWDSRNQLFLLSPTRLSRSMAARSSALRLTEKLVPETRTPHLLFLTDRIRFVLFRFRSTLITESLLFSFPAGTGMLRFPAFPFITEQFRNPRFKACMRLAMAYRSLPRPSTVPKPSHPLYGLLNS